MSFGDHCFLQIFVSFRINPARTLLAPFLYLRLKISFRLFHDWCCILSDVSSSTIVIMNYSLVYLILKESQLLLLRLLKYLGHCNENNPKTYFFYSCLRMAHQAIYIGVNFD